MISSNIISDTEFMQAYGQWIKDDLAIMPCETDHDKNQRFECLKQQSWYSDFIVSALTIVQKSTGSKPEDFDQLKSFEALTEIIKTFTGYTVKDSHREVNFLAALINRYNQKISQEKTQEKIETRLPGGITGFSGETRSKFPKTIRLLNTWASSNGKNPSELTQKDLARFTEINHLTKDMNNLLLEYLSCSTESIDKNGDDHEEMQISDHGSNNPETNFFKDENYKEIMEKFLKFIIQGDLKGIIGARERDNFRIFTMVNFLKELKLDDNGERYKEQPAGNEDTYDILSDYEDYLLKKPPFLFDPRYLEIAINYKDDSHKKNIARNLYDDVYYPFLKDKKEFNFRDKDLAKALGVSTKTISQKRTNYESTVKMIKKCRMFCIE